MCLAEKAGRRESRERKTVQGIHQKMSWTRRVPTRSIVRGLWVDTMVLQREAAELRRVMVR